MGFKILQIITQRDCGYVKNYINLLLRIYIIRDLPDKTEIVNEVVNLTFFNVTNEQLLILILISSKEVMLLCTCIMMMVYTHIINNTI